MFLSLPNTWASLNLPREIALPVYRVEYRGLSFHGQYSLEDDDAGFPAVVALETLSIGMSKKNVIQAIDPAVIHWIEKEIQEYL